MLDLRETVKRKRQTVALREQRALVLHLLQLEQRPQQVQRAHQLVLLREVVLREVEEERDPRQVLAHALRDNGQQLLASLQRIT